MLPPASSNLSSAGIFTDKKVSQMFAKTDNEMLPVEPVVNNFVDDKQCITDIALHNSFHNPEKVIVIEHVQVFDHIFIGDVFPAKAYNLVENGKGITKGAI
ncbi:MAG: hypothetical protein MZV63_09715 [Marinilabiliales bacterium]|nr:hypothetical protein [Marinilabiliales bacterium]